MKWIKRGLWLAAWGVWVWCGYGLHRELPRDVGRLLCRLPLLESEKAEGFVADLDAVVCLTEGVHGDELHVRVLDALTGSLRLNYLPETLGDRFPVSYFISFRHGFLVWNHSREIGHAQCRALDLRTGAVANLGAALDGWAGVAEQRPWLLSYAFSSRCQVSSDELRLPRTSISAEVELDRVEVVDLRSGMSVFSRARPALTDQLLEVSDGPFFTADSSMVAIPAVHRGSANPTVADLQLEFYAIDDPSRPKVILGGVTADGTWCTSMTGRIVCRRAGDHEGPLLVFEIATGRLISEIPSTCPKDNEPGRDIGVLSMAPDGSSVLDIKGRRIWSVDSQRPIWHQVTEGAIDVAARTDLFVTEESLLELLDQFIDKGNFHVRRRMPDGQTLFRTSEPIAIERSGTNAAQSMSVSQDGIVRSFPPRINYPLLALCQTILALPLIMLWATLRWRWKRRMRLASVTP